MVEEQVAKTIILFWVLVLKTMVLLVGGPIIKSGDREPADLGDQAVRVALLQVEAHFSPNHTYTVYTNWSSRCCFICYRLFHVHSSAKSWYSIHKYHYLAKKWPYAAHGAEVLSASSETGIAWYCIRSVNACVEIFYHLSFLRADFTYFWDIDLFRLFFRGSHVCAKWTAWAKV